MRAKTVLLSVFILSGLYAQSVSVQSIVPVLQEYTQQYYHPQFSPDDSKLLLTRSNFRGLYYYDLDSGILTELSAELGAGYQPVFSPDGRTIYFRSYIQKNRRRYFSFVGFDTGTSLSTVYEKDKRDLSPPIKTNTGSLLYKSDDRIEQVENNRLKKSSGPEVSAQIFKSRSILISSDGENNILQPKGKRLYLWPSVSPDGTKLLFTVAGGGTFISDLDGNILTELGYANAPSWSPDGKWVVYMKDRDDGYTFTGSDIYLASVYGGSELNISNTSNVIELYPSWSHDGQQIVCSTDTGAIYLINLEWK